MSHARDALPIDIVGLSVRSAAGQSKEEFWRGLSERHFELSSFLREDREARGLVEDELGFDVKGADVGAVIADFGADWRALKIPPLQMERMHRMERASLAVMAEALMDAGIMPSDGPHPAARVVIASTGLGVDLLTDQRRRIRRFDLARPAQQAILESAAEDAEDALELVDGLFNLAAPPVDADSLMTSAAMAGGRIANLFDLRGGHFSVDAGRLSSTAALECAADILATSDAPFVLVGAHTPLLSPSRVAEAAAAGRLGDGAPQPFSGKSRIRLGEAAAALVVTRAGEWKKRADRPYATLRVVTHASIENAAPSLVSRSIEDALDVADLASADVAAIETTACGRGEEELRVLEGFDDAFRSVVDVEERPSMGTTCDRFGDLGPAAGLVVLAKGALSLSRGRSVGQSSDDTTSIQRRFPLRARRLAGQRAVLVSDWDARQIAHCLLTHPRTRAQTRLRRSNRRRQSERIAIVGCGVVAPRANDVGEFWKIVSSGASAIGDLPFNRWDVDALLQAGTEVAPLLRTRLAGVVDDTDLLPATAARPEPSWTLAEKAALEAVGMLSARSQAQLKTSAVDVVIGQLPYRWAEAEHERRLLFRGHLRLVREALEDMDFAASTIDRIAKRANALFEPTSVQRWERAEELSTSSSTANAVAQRIGMRGGGCRWAVDAACASSLLAVDVAAKRLVRGRVDVAVVGGVAFNLLPEYYISLSLLGALSPTGIPPFAPGADGFVPAEGAAAFVLRRLEDAEQGGDDVIAVIDGIGVSSDGAGRSIFAPNPIGEAAAIERALVDAGVGVDDVDYVEAHGTGTELGDETELETYSTVFDERDPASPLPVGTVKAQIGHQSSAAGASGLLKVALALRAKTLPGMAAGAADDGEPSRPMPKAVTLSEVTRPWHARRHQPRRAGVSAFGLGGINAHLILSEHACGGPKADADDDNGVGQPPPRGPRADRLSVELVPIGAARRDLSLKKKRVLITALAPSEISTAVAAELQARGAEIETLWTNGETPASTEARFASQADIDFVLDLHALGENAGVELVDDAVAAAHHFMTRLRGAYELLEKKRTAYFAATRMGGDLGLLGSTDEPLVGGVVLGMLKGLRQEMGIKACGIDFSPSEAPQALATKLADELQDAGDRVEVGYIGGRHAPVFRRRPFVDEASQKAPQGVVVFTGGGRGVTFECALGLARTGTPVVVTGRSPIPEPDDVTQLSAEAFEAWVTESLQRARASDPAMTPVRFAREVADPMRRARELLGNLARAEACHAPLQYRACDVLKADEVQRVVDDAVAEHGRLGAVVHGAMVEHSTSLLRKSASVIDATLRTKIGGGHNVLMAAARHQPEAIVFFGSGAGRFGNRGQIDYCGANNAMAAQLQSLARRHLPTTRAICIDWTAWEDVGAAARDPDLAARVAETGVSSIAPVEGVYWFLNELAQGQTGERLICEEQILDVWGGLGPAASEQDKAVVDVGGSPLRAGHWPFVGRVLQRDANGGEAERRLHPRIDHYLPQHTLHGDPIFPMAFGVELLAEAAQALCAVGSERVVDHVENLEVSVPAKVYRDRPLVLTLAARVDAEGGADVETTSALVVNGKVLDPKRLHHRGRVGFRAADIEALERVTLSEVVGKESARSFFHLAKDPIGLGPSFSLASNVVVGEDSVSAFVRPPRLRDVFRFTSSPRFYFDPFVLDASWQVASNWDALLNGWVCVPVRVAKVWRGRPRGRSEAARVRVDVREVVGDEVSYDVDVVGEDGALLLRTTAMVLKRIAKVNAS